MEELARVVAVHEDHVVVESQVKSTCSSCQQVDNCGSGIVAKAIPHKKMTLDIETKESFSIGEQVIISIPEQALLSVAWRVYLWPLIGLILLAGLGHYGAGQLKLNGELLSIVLGVCGGYLGFLVSRKHLNNDAQQQALLPTVKQRLITTQSVN